MSYDNKYIKVLGYLISIIFLYVTFKNTDLNLIFNYLYVGNIYLLLAALLFYIFFFVVRGFYQINNLLFLKSDIPFFISFSSLGIAQFYNVIFPARLGEVIRAFFLSKKQGLQKASILSYVFIEKFLDMLIILLFLLLIIFLRTKNTELMNLLTFFSILSFSIIFSAIGYIQFNKPILHFIHLISPNKVHSLIDRFNLEILDGLKFFKTTRQVIKSILLLLLSWAIMLGVFWLVSYPYVKLLGMPFYSCLFFMVFSALSLCIPSAPAGIGVMHYSFLLSIKILMGGNIDAHINVIAAFVINMHFIIMLLDIMTGGGIIAFYKFKSNH